MKRHLYFAIPAVLIFTQTLRSETVAGLVADTATGTPVAGARVTLFSSDLPVVP